MTVARVIGVENMRGKKRKRCALVLTCTVIVVLGAPLAAHSQTDEPQPRPLHILRTIEKEAANPGFLVGVGLASQYHPIIKGVSSAISIAEFIGETGVEAGEYLVQTDLLLIDKRAKRLEEIRHSGKDLKSDPEAKKIVAELEQLKVHALERNSPYTFFARGLASQRALYIGTRKATFYFGAKFLGKRIATWMGMGDGVKRYWVDRGELLKGTMPRAARRQIWKSLESIGEFSKKLADNLNTVVVTLILKKAVIPLVDQWLSERLDWIYKDILERFPPPPSAAGYVGNGLRLEIVTRPEFALPVFQRIAEAAIALPRHVQPVAVPLNIQRSAEPVVDTIGVEHQFISTQNYDVETRYRTPEPREHPMRSGDIDPDVTRLFRRSFDGTRGGNLWH